MHESRLIADLIDEADRRAPAGGATITALTLRIGALSAVSPASLRHGIARQAEARWNTNPEIAIETGGLPTDRDALGVTLLSMRVGD